MLLYDAYCIIIYYYLLPDQKNKSQIYQLIEKDLSKAPAVLGIPHMSEANSIKNKLNMKLILFNSSFGGAYTIFCSILELKILVILGILWEGRQKEREEKCTIGILLSQLSGLLQGSESFIVPMLYPAEGQPLSTPQVSPFSAVGTMQFLRLFLNPNPFLDMN